ncbi:MAG: 4-(cytidine 5'-diphospho)-2-C-methyl-D-erythritol kinase [Bacteroidota bacterium]
MFTLHAHAKINLGLRIIGMLPNGYHAIHSLFLPIRCLYDTLTFELAESAIDLHTNDKLGIPPNDNLIVKAAKSLQIHTGTKHGAIIQLDKRIPSGAGMGGGSSDAACTLKGLITLWNLHLQNDELQAIALKIGSDVPFFLQDQPAIVDGQGEIIIPTPLELNYWILIIYPQIHIGTAWAYSQISQYALADFTRFESCIQDHSLSFNTEHFINDFEEPIFKTYPELLRIKNKLLESGADIALMSGSGSTMFGLFTKKEIAIATAEYFTMYPTFVLPLNDQHKGKDV